MKEVLFLAFIIFAPYTFAAERDVGVDTGYGPTGAKKRVALPQPVENEGFFTDINLSLLEFDPKKGLYRCPYSGERPQKHWLQPLSQEGDDAITAVLKPLVEKGRTVPEEREEGDSKRLKIEAAKAQAVGSLISAEKGEEIPERVIGRQDGRQEVKDPKDFPWSVHGHMIMKYSDAAYIGSGTLIQNNVVLTAGHNLYDVETKEFPSEVNFFPGLARGDDMTKAIGSRGLSMKVHQYYYTPGSRERGEYDIAALLLEEPLGEEVGFYGIKALPKPELEGLDVTIAGYPGDKDRGKVMYSMSGNLKTVTERKLYYEIDTAGGQSGSGIWHQKTEEEAPFCVGVHAYGGETENSGTRINEDKKEVIKKWINAFSSEKKKDTEE